MQEIMFQKSKGKMDCQSEASDLFKKLSDLRVEFDGQFSNIINSHSSNINDGIQDLYEEVCGLKIELSDMRKERKVLLETVDNLNGEISQGKA